MLTRFAQTTTGTTVTTYGVALNTAWVIESANSQTAPLVEAHIEKLIENSASFAVITGSLRSIINPATDGIAIIATDTDEEIIKYLIIGGSALAMNKILHETTNQAYTTGSVRTHGYTSEITLLTSGIKSCYTPNEPIESLLKKFTHTATLNPHAKDTGYSILVLQI